MSQEVFRLSEDINNETVEETSEDNVEDVVDIDVDDDVVDMSEFVVIDEFPAYECNRLGQIRNARTGKLLKGGKNSKGYHQIGLYKDGKKIGNTIRADKLSAEPNPSFDDGFGAIR